ncbi:MAG: formyl transferase [Methyloceanibacter sp.]|uniref:formyl transferase n=1 Tax=Methyloceanibacter sp. TaxID=1965321 RepID=UPI003D6C9F64
MARDSADPRRIVVLVAEGELANIVVNHLASRFGPITVLKEEPESKRAILRRRTRLVGPVYACGQALCGILLKIVAKRSRARIREICAEHGLAAGAPVDVEIVSVGSVNSEACRRALKEIDPQVVAVYGTRIIGKQALAAVACPFINYHAGITPKYRGQHPAYWARVENDADHAGMTIHLVDEGVDTGAVLYQAPVRFAPGDNITTYQFVQMAAALPLFVRAIEDALTGRLAQDGRPAIEEVVSADLAPVCDERAAPRGVVSECRRGALAGLIPEIEVPAARRVPQAAVEPLRPQAFLAWARAGQRAGPLVGEEGGLPALADAFGGDGARGREEE